jgi:hypothetical protein
VFSALLTVEAGVTSIQPLVMCASDGHFTRRWIHVLVTINWQNQASSVGVQAGVHNKILVTSTYQNDSQQQPAWIGTILPSILHIWWGTSCFDNLHIGRVTNQWHDRSPLVMYLWHAVLQPFRHWWGYSKTSLTIRIMRLSLVPCDQRRIYCHIC